MASIRKHGKAYQVRWYTLAGPETSRPAPNYGAAKALKLEVEEALACGREWRPDVTGEEPSIKDVANAYVKYRAARHVAGARISANTLRMDGVHLELFVRFCTTKSKAPTVSILSRSLLQEYMLWLAKPETSRHKKKRAGITIARIIQAAQWMWEWAEDSDQWPGMIPRPRLLADLPESPALPVIAPTWQEMDACVHACNGWLRRLATWLRYTGLRVGESMLIEWQDIDTERGELTIRPEIDKNGVGRTIPLCQLILDEIATWDTTDIGKRTGFIIPFRERPNAGERAPRTSRNMARAWKRANVREAVWKKRPDHCFRKGFKTNLLALGAHPDAVDALQGHSLGAGSRGRYIDSTRLPLRETLALIPPIAAPTDNVLKLPTDKRRTGQQRHAANG